MYRIGVFDDEKDQIDLIEEKFELYGLKNNIEFEIIKSLEYDLREKDKVVEWILNKKLDSIIMDFKTLGIYNFSGVELINYINNILIGFPCILLTARKEEVKHLELVVDSLIYDKSEVLSESIESEALVDFIEKLLHKIKIFKNQLSKNEEIYKDLLERHKKGINTEGEEKELKSIHKILVSYEIIEDIPLESNVIQIEKELENLISKLQSKL